MMLIHQRITNAYRGVHNLVVAITPKALPPGSKALLLNAHFDNTLGSPGAHLIACYPSIQQLGRGVSLAGKLGRRVALLRGARAAGGGGAGACAGMDGLHRGRFAAHVLASQCETCWSITPLTGI